jgi:hypothetical protein
MSRQQKAIIGGLLAGLGLGIIMALILNIALTQLNVGWAGPSPFPADGLATFLSVLAGLGIGLGGGTMVASLTREDAPAFSPAGARPPGQAAGVAHGPLTGPPPPAPGVPPATH